MASKLDKLRDIMRKEPTQANTQKVKDQLIKDYEDAKKDKRS